MRTTSVAQVWSVDRPNVWELVDTLEFLAVNVANSDEIEWFVDEGTEAIGSDRMSCFEA